MHTVKASRGDLRVARRRAVGEGDGAVDSVRALVRLAVLPHPPNTVDLSVMKVEPWVTVGRDEVTAWVATDREVTGSVHAHEVVLESWNATLHIGPEALDGLALEQGHDLLVVGPLARSPSRDVALQAPRVVAKTKEGQLLRVGEVAVRVRWRAGQVAEHRSHVHTEVLEGTVSKATAARAVWDHDQRRVLGWDTVASLVRASEDTVAAHAGRAAVEYGRCQRVDCPLGPVVIGLVAIVSALIAKSLLVGPGEEAMPA